MKFSLDNKNIEANRGITLIALIVTIIVLLILAGVTIATLTGDNGLLQKAQEAKNTSIEAEGLERIQLAVMASHDNNGINITSLAKNLSEIEGLKYTNEQNQEVDIKENTEITLPRVLKHNNFKYKIKKDGTVSIYNPIIPEEYQELEYIKSTGTQYIDTNYYSKVETHVEIKFSYLEDNNEEYNNGLVFGSADNADR